jgi:uncharacterized protein DUF6544
MLPSSVRRYLEIATASRTSAIGQAHLVHGGTFRPRGDQWLSIRGDEDFTTDPPGFVWHGRVRVAPCVWIDARDQSIKGQGSMRVRLESIWTLANVQGPEIDQGALVRLLGEMPWFPTALADDRYVTWTELDASSARATLRVHGREVSGVFYFGADGLPERFTAERHRDLGNGHSVVTPFEGRYRDYRHHRGVLVPFEVEASWLLDDGLFPYARFVLDAIEFEPGLQ